MLERLSDTDRLEKSDARLKLQNDLRATALQAIAGLAVLAGAALGFQQLTEDRQQAVADRELSRQGQASERFTRAISQLGSDRREVQLGGIYGLEQIAQQAPANRLAVTEVLVAYLHRRVPQPPEPVSPPWDELRVRAPDVQAALTVLARRHSESHDPPLDLQALDLRSADLPRSNLSRVNLAGGNLSGAELLLANLAGAMVPGTDLTQARLHGANLSKATVNDSKLAFANLHRANLSSAYLYNASLRHALLSRADLSNADLSMANLSDAKLVHTNLHNALLSATLFIRADLRGADLRGVDVTGGDFRKAEANASTRWPVGFDWRREKVRMFS